MPDLRATIWIKPEVLELAVSPIISAEKISIDMLSRLLHHCTELGEVAYPQLTYSKWKHISVKKMGLTLECASVLFYTCLIFSTKPENLKTVEAEMALSSSTQEKEEILNDTTVSTLELILLLYLHRINSAHPRTQASHASYQCLTNDPWPGSVVSSSKKEKEEVYFEFIKDSLSEIIGLLSGQLFNDENDKNKSSRRNSKFFCFMKSAGVISPEVVRSLGFIFGCSYHGEKDNIDLIGLATDKQNAYQSGFLESKPKKGSFLTGFFKKWILSQLVSVAPYSEINCLKGKRLLWPIVTFKKHSSYNLLTTPIPCGVKLNILTELHESLCFYSTSDCVQITDLKVKKCSKTYLYILQPFRNVVIQKCFDCQIVLGPVSGRIVVQECRNSVIICPARSLVINNCRSITAHTLTPHGPVLVGSKSQAITLAPLNFHYPKLLHHLNVASILPNFNVWNQPTHLGLDCVIKGTYDVMNPDDFRLLPMPFSENSTSPAVSTTNSGTSKSKPPLLPPGLPHEFAKSVEACRKNASSLRQEIREAKLTQEQRILLQKSIDAKFENWLKDSGKQYELDLFEKMNSFLKNFQNVAKTTSL